MPQNLHPTLQNWLDTKKFKSFPFQQECRKAYLNGESGILNAPTGSGKTLALWLPCLEEYLLENPDWDKPSNRKNGLRVLWITPLRALTKDIARAMQEVCDEIRLPWRIAMRTGDTTTSERQKQLRNMPECLLTTPESLHMLLASKKYKSLFKNLQTVVVDEWHELLGTKRGVQVELGISRLRTIRTDLKVWGISATIGNLEQAGEVLIPTQKITFVKANIQKKINVQSIIPDEVEKFPWAGNMGTRLVHKVLPIIEQSKTTLIFTNTRAKTEIWYQHLLNHKTRFGWSDGDAPRFFESGSARLGGGSFARGDFESRGLHFKFGFGSGFPPRGNHYSGRKPERRGEISATGGKERTPTRCHEQCVFLAGSRFRIARRSFHETSDSRNYPTRKYSLYGIS